jgi:uncharacterized protein with NAD-binding domain and iron-sulfur cluster
VTAVTAALQDDERGSSGEIAPEKTDQIVSKSLHQAKRRVTVVGAGWAGLSAAHWLLYQGKSRDKEAGGSLEVTLIDASPRAGGLVRDGFDSLQRKRKAEAGQHGFWKNYRNIYQFLTENFDLGDVLTNYAPQGQYSPRGLEAVWPVYRNQQPRLLTGLAQLVYTDFLRLPLADRASALPLALVLSDCGGPTSEAFWRRYDSVSFYDLCRQLGVSRRCYEEAFEPMVLTGLFAPGRECSAAAALGMAYFFVLQSQDAFDVQWCRGNVGERIFEPWIEQMQLEHEFHLELSTRVEGFEILNDAIRSVVCRRDDGSSLEVETDNVILAVSAKALSGLATRFSNLDASYDEFRRFANLRGTSVLATRVYLDRNLTVPYSANTCWGFHRDVGMTVFDLRALHGLQYPPADASVGSVLEVDYYHANSLLALSDEDLIHLVKADLDALLGSQCEQSRVVDAAVVRLPSAVNWYFPGSYASMPGLSSESIRNLHYAGDVVKTDHGSWSQEKAFVTGKQAANLVLGRPVDHGVLPVEDDEVHVQLGRLGFQLVRSLFPCDGL